MKVLNESHNHLYEVVKPSLILSHGYTGLESGFSIKNN